MQTIKNSIFSAALLLVVIAFSACEKESQTTITTETNQQLATESSTAVRAKIENFLQNVENPSLLKSGQTMSLDSAVWYTEAALNFNCCRHNSNSIGNSFKDSTYSITLNTVGGAIALDEVMDIYNTFESNVLAYKNSLPDDEQLLFADVELSEQNTELTTRLVVTTNEDEGDDVPNCWIWGMGLGRCDGQYIGRDAASEVHANIPATGVIYPTQTNDIFYQIEEELYPDSLYHVYTYVPLLNMTETGNTLHNLYPSISFGHIGVLVMASANTIERDKSAKQKECVEYQFEDIGFTFIDDDLIEKTRKRHQLSATYAIVLDLGE